MKANRKLKSQILIDSILGIAFLLAFQPRFTGLSIHEWMGVGLGAVVLVHIGLAWSWVVNVTKRLFQKLPNQTRLLYAINMLLMIAFIGVSVTGVMISEVVFPQIGGNHELVGIHKLFANGILLLMSLHLALNWQWVVNVWNKQVVQALANRRAPKPQTAPVPAVVYATIRRDSSKNA